MLARVTGKSLGALLAERIFAPLGMHDTGFTCRRPSSIGSPPAYWTDFKTGERIVFDEAPAAGSPGRRRSSRAAAGWSRRSTTIWPSAA